MPRYTPSEAEIEERSTAIKMDVELDIFRTISRCYVNELIAPSLGDICSRWTRGANKVEGRDDDMTTRIRFSHYVGAIKLILRDGWTTLSTSFPTSGFTTRGRPYGSSNQLLLLASWGPTRAVSEAMQWKRWCPFTFRSWSWTSEPAAPTKYPIHQQSNGRVLWVLPPRRKLTRFWSLGYSR